MDWRSGYVSDVDYTFGYYGELNPLRVKLAFLFAGLKPPRIETACELGFGQGVSINIHAAASIISFFGTDFNPAQAAFADELAQASGANVQIFDDSFAEFCNRTDLPYFDYIGLHGIWSWISDENRKNLNSFFTRRLKAGGAAYISYNTLPGWAPFSPFRQLMADHVHLLSAQGSGIINRIDEAIMFAEKLWATNPAYKLGNPQITERLNQIKSQDRRYLAHEYFNQDWHPIHFSTMAEVLASSKLQFACSAHFLEHIDSINLSSEQQQLLQSVTNNNFRQSVRDFMVNQFFRRDFWVKGAQKLSALGQAEQIRALRIVLIRNRADVGLTVTGAAGAATLSTEIYNPILDILADHKSKTITEVENSVTRFGINFNQLLQAVMILAGQGDIATAQDLATIEQVKTQCNRLNLYLFNKARSSSDITFVACPVTGGGVPMDRFQQLFLLARSNGLRKVEEWVDFVWAILAAQGQKLIKDGKVLEGEVENKAELLATASKFEKDYLPKLQALLIA